MPVPQNQSLLHYNFSDLSFSLFQSTLEILVILSVGIVDQHNRVETHTLKLRPVLGLSAQAHLLRTRHSLRQPFSNLSTVSTS